MNGVKSRRSKQRDIILSIIENDHTHPTAEVVYNIARKELPDISLGTVYRNLKFLNEQGKITAINTSDNTVHYDSNIDDHHHMVCIHCGNIIDVHIKKQLLDQLENDFIQEGLQLVIKPILFQGICKDCQKVLKEELK